MDREAWRATVHGIIKESDKTKATQTHTHNQPNVLFKGYILKVKGIIKLTSRKQEENVLCRRAGRHPVSSAKPPSRGHMLQCCVST